MSQPSGKPSARNWDELMEGIWRQNPVFVMVLGMCPTLAVTVSGVNALSMGLATTFVLVCSCGLVSLLRKLIPKEVRIATYIVIIATFVTVVDYVIQAVSLALYDALGAFIQLIVVNCIILARAEAFASKNPVLHSAMDGIGMGIGFTIALTLIGSIREILGNGTIFGNSVFGPSYQPMLLLILPAGGFIVFGLLLALFNVLSAKAAGKKEAKKQ